MISLPILQEMAIGEGLASVPHSLVDCLNQFRFAMVRRVQTLPRAQNRPVPNWSRVSDTWASSQLQGIPLPRRDLQRLSEFVLQH